MPEEYTITVKPHFNRQKFVGWEIDTQFVKENKGLHKMVGCYGSLDETVDRLKFLLENCNKL